jgi:hypothetical protein
MSDSFLAGFRLYHLDRYAEAEREFRRHLAEDPNDAGGHAWLAMCLVDLERLEEATDEAQPPRSRLNSDATVSAAAWHSVSRPR